MWSGLITPPSAVVNREGLIVATTRDTCINDTILAATKQHRKQNKNKLKTRGIPIGEDFITSKFESQFPTPAAFYTDRDTSCDRRLRHHFYVSMPIPNPLLHSTRVGIRIDLKAARLRCHAIDCKHNLGVGSSWLGKSEIRADTPWAIHVHGGMRVGGVHVVAAEPLSGRLEDYSRLRLDQLPLDLTNHIMSDDPQDS